MTFSIASATLSALVIGSATVLSGCQASPQSATPSGDAESAGVAAVVSRAGLTIDGSAVTAAGYVSGVIEDDGTCTFTFTSGETSVSDTTDAAPDATTTTCGELTLPIDRLGAGAWTVRLSYSSDGSSVESEPLELEIP